jgi:hypothetical protein
MAVHDAGRMPGPLPDDLRVLMRQIIDADVPVDRVGEALRCCLDAVDFGRRDGGPDSGAKARRAASLLLEHDCADLPWVTRSELAVTCQLIVLGVLVRARASDSAPDLG